MSTISRFSFGEVHFRTFSLVLVFSHSALVPDTDRTIRGCAGSFLGVIHRCNHSQFTNDTTPKCSDTTTWLQSVCRPVSYSATRVFLMALMKPQQTYRVFVGRSLMALQSVSYDTTTDYKAFVDRFCVTLQNL